MYFLVGREWSIGKANSTASRSTYLILTDKPEALGSSILPGRLGAVIGVLLAVHCGLGGSHRS